MLDEKVIKQIAGLAKLEITEELAKEYSLQLSSVLRHFEEISAVNTDNIEPLVTPAEIESYWREDEVTKDFETEEITKNAPDKIGNLFRVPPVV